MKLYVPEIGDRLKLTSDWTFNLQYEYRNRPLLEHFGFTFSWKSGQEKYETVTIPKGTVLKVDRIYVRKGAQEFSSITFYSEKIAKGKSARFWAKLSDCNKIEFEVEEQVDTSKPPLSFWYVREFKKTENTTTHGNPNKEGNYVPRNHNEVYDIMMGQKWNSSTVAYRARVEFNETVKLTDSRQNSSGGLFGVPIRKYTSNCWEIKRPNLKYTLYDLKGNEIGSWGSLATLKKYAKEHYAKQ